METDWNYNFIFYEKWKFHFEYLLFPFYYYSDSFCNLKVNDYGDEDFEKKDHPVISRTLINVDKIIRIILSRRWNGTGRASELSFLPRLLFYVGQCREAVDDEKRKEIFQRRKTKEGKLLCRKAKPVLVESSLLVSNYGYLFWYRILCVTSKLLQKFRERIRSRLIPFDRSIDRFNITKWKSKRSREKNKISL